MAPQLLFRRDTLEDLPPLELPEGYALRPARPGDEAGIAETLTASFGEPWDEDRVRRDLTETEFVKTVFVVESNGQVVATASAASGGQWEGLGYVHWVGTHPGHQGKALGYWVSLACLHEFRRLGYPRAVLHTDDPRLPAIKTYLKLGFVPDLVADPSFPERWDKVSVLLGGGHPPRP